MVRPPERSMDLADPHPITLSPTSGWPALNVEVGFTSEHDKAGTYSGPYSLYMSEDSLKCFILHFSKVTNGVHCHGENACQGTDSNDNNEN